MAVCEDLLDKQGKLSKHDTDLTLCGICQAPIYDDPKALPCLHTFCLGCIEEWAKGKKDRIVCPLCKEDFVIPPQGVSGFRSNFFVTNLVKTNVMMEVVAGHKMKCTCCKNDGIAVARCLDCKAYLCDASVKFHTTMNICEGHRVYSFEDIRSGKVDVKKLHVQEYCGKHLGQVVWFFCESCGILICRDCTVIDHPPSSHTLVNVEDVFGVQRKKMKKLVSQCQQVAERVDDAIQTADNVEKDLETCLQQADESVDKITKEIIARVKAQQQMCKMEIRRVGNDHRDKIAVEKDKLKLQQSQISRAIDIADSITKSGSPYDLAATYTSLTNTMQKLCDTDPGTVSSDLASVKFVPNDDLTALPELGSLEDSCGVYAASTCKHDLSGEWELSKKICEHGTLGNATGFALYPSGDIAVACCTYDGQVKVLDQHGAFKHDIDVNGSVTSTPWSVAISKKANWQTYVTDTTPVVKVFDMNGKLVNTFKTTPPATSRDSSYESSLYGLAIDRDDQVLVGDSNFNYISIHKLCGTHVSSFETTITPNCIATAPNNDNTIIISQYQYYPSCEILDYTGRVLHTYPCKDMDWAPTGACFNGDKEFLIANHGGFFANHGGLYNMKPGIHHYSSQGDYLGCITTDVKYPRDVVITGDGKILVLEWLGQIKVFTKK